MPHIKDEEKAKLEETLRITKMGELCYAFAEGVKTQYLAEPRWGSIHNIARALFINPFHEEWSHEIIRKYAAPLSQADIKTAAFLCLLEFYGIVGRKYEDGMIQQNGNVFAGLPIPSLGDYVIPLGKKLAQEDSKGDLMPFIAPPATPEALFEVEPNVFPDEGAPVVAPVKRGRGRPKKVVA